MVFLKVFGDFSERGVDAGIAEKVKNAENEQTCRNDNRLSEKARLLNHLVGLD